MCALAFFSLIYIFWQLAFIIVLCYLFKLSLVTDELIKEVQIGCYFSFVVLPSCEIQQSSVHFQCTPVFEVRC